MSNLLNPTAQEEGIKLLSFLEKRLGLPKAMLHRWVREGQCRVNGKRCAPFMKLQPGDLVRVPPFAVNMAPEKAQMPGNMVPAADPATTLALPCYLPPAKPAQPDKLDTPAGVHRPNRPISPADKLLLLQQLEDDLLVLCKAPGLATQPGSGHTDSVSARLAGLFSGQAFVPAPAHRLDYGSSGLILAGRTLKAQQWLHSLFAEKSRPSAGAEAHGLEADGPEAEPGRQSALRKEYLVWVSGRWPALEQLLEDELVVERGPNGQERITIARPEKQGALAKKQNARPTAAPGATVAPESTAGPSPTAAPGAQGPRKALAVARLLGFLNFAGRYAPFEPGFEHTAGTGAETFASLLRIELITGRKHQIRVQCAGRGHPVIGDAHYGGIRQLPKELCRAFAGSAGQTRPARLSGPDGAEFTGICPQGFMLHAEALYLADGRVFRCPPPWPWPFNQYYTPTPIKG